ncbi:hypothetical protein ACIQF5_20810 [Streptomyces goshikiensis]|uniref:hypothetical protein n=1 Tax=Streptomyces goshikiensis TaxID=1942 RepID=UPI003800F52D
MFSESERHGSTGGRLSVFKKPDRSTRAASARGEAFRISGRTSKPKRGWGKR